MVLSKERLPDFVQVATLLLPNWPRNILPNNKTSFLRKTFSLSQVPSIATLCHHVAMVCGGGCSTYKIRLDHKPEACMMFSWGFGLLQGCVWSVHAWALWSTPFGVVNGSSARDLCIGAIDMTGQLSTSDCCYILQFVYHTYIANFCNQFLQLKRICTHFYCVFYYSNTNWLQNILQYMVWYTSCKICNVCMIE